MPDSTDTAYALSWLSSIWGINDCRVTSAGELHYLMTLVLMFRDDRHPSVTELAQLLERPSSNVSRYVNKHMQKGYVEERVDQHDRRRRVLYPTEKGRLEIEKLEGRLQRFLTRRRAGDTEPLTDVCLELSQA